MNIRFLIALLALFSLSTVSAAQQADRTIFDGLSFSAEALEVSIETDLASLIDNRKTEDYQKAVFSFENASGTLEVHEIKVKPRGKFRRSVCDFPPVKLNFSKDRLLSSGYIAEYDKLKLVTHCLDDKFVSKENVAKEYLAYRLYNELTPKSYRAQLVKITYIDTKNRISRIKRYGFILEDTDEMAHRAGGKECEECLNVPKEGLSLADENRMAVFQYMIGNADYSTPMMRNVKMVTPYMGSGIIPVPYDFDFSGLVAPSYALPNSDYGLVSVKQRVFLGEKVDAAILAGTLEEFRNKRAAMQAIVNGFKLLSRQGREEVLQYLDTFYEEAEAILSSSPVQHELRAQAVKDSVQNSLR